MELFALVVIAIVLDVLSARRMRRHSTSVDALAAMMKVSQESEARLRARLDSLATAMVVSVERERERELQTLRTLQSESLHLVQRLRQANPRPKSVCVPLPELPADDVGRDERETVVATPAQMTAGEVDGEERDSAEELTKVLDRERSEDLGEWHIKRALREVENTQGVVGLGVPSWARVVLGRARAEQLGVSDTVAVISDVERDLETGKLSERNAALVAGAITARILARKHAPGVLERASGEEE